MQTQITAELNPQSHPQANVVSESKARPGSTSRRSILGLGALGSSLLTTGCGGGSSDPDAIDSASNNQIIHTAGIGEANDPDDDPDLTIQQTDARIERAPSGAKRFTPVSASSGRVEVPQVEKMTMAEASRFMAQASMGASYNEISALKEPSAIQNWLVSQLTAPRSFGLCNWIERQPEFDNVSVSGMGPFFCASWRSLIQGNDTLRQRMAFALSEIFVVNVEDLGVHRGMAAARYMDYLLSHAFGNFRTLLSVVTRSHAMARYLTYFGNKKANPAKGTIPDENFAREIMQLFTIGLYELNLDGTPKLKDGKPIETYDQKDIMGLARVFTGLVSEEPLNREPETRNAVRRRLIMNDRLHETGAKRFLGTKIPAGTSGYASLRIALDTLFNHPNVGPFICKQLIQRLVTSNPSPAYVRRVARVFNSDIDGVRGNLGQVLVAILLDPEARQVSNHNTAGKVREPLLRFTQWARAFGAKSPTGMWGIGDTASDDRLGQGILRSPTVFNFFRPSFVPPNSPIAKAGAVAPEFQIIDEVSIAGYINTMQHVISKEAKSIEPDYSEYTPLSNTPERLVNRLSLVLTHGQMSEATKQQIVQAIGTIPSTKQGFEELRVQVAILLIMASPEYLVFI